MKPNRQQYRVWQRARRAESQYAIQLRKIARNVGDLVRSHQFEIRDNVIDISGIIFNTLQRYAEVLDPWARAAAKSMAEEIAARDATAWGSISDELSRNVAREIKDAPIGHLMQQIMAEQIELIKSLPLEAAQRVHELAIRSVSTGERANDLIDEIMRTGEVTLSRATAIAQTEVGRASTALTEARHTYTGGTHYIFRTSKDSIVRPSHRPMEGVVVAWNAPPTLDGMTGHAGTFPRCRCYCEPIIPDLDDNVFQMRN